MVRSRYRSAYVLPSAVVAAFGLVVASAVGGSRPALAQTASDRPESDALASMQCDRASEPGRIRCAVELRLVGGRTLAWADVEILSLPDFASALKGRIGPQDALARDPTSTKWALGLVARRAGQGEVRARVRGVACEPPRAADAGAGAPRCAPITVDVKTPITVG